MLFRSCDSCEFDLDSEGLCFHFACSPLGVLPRLIVTKQYRKHAKEPSENAPKTETFSKNFQLFFQRMPNPRIIVVAALYSLQSAFMASLYSGNSVSFFLHSIQMQSVLNIDIMRPPDNSLPQRSQYFWLKNVSISIYPVQIN